MSDPIISNSTPYIFKAPAKYPKAHAAPQEVPRKGYSISYMTSGAGRVMTYLATPFKSLWSTLCASPSVVREQWTTQIKAGKAASHRVMQYMGLEKPPAPRKEVSMPMTSIPANPVHMPATPVSARLQQFTCAKTIERVFEQIDIAVAKRNHDRTADFCTPPTFVPAVVVLIKQTFADLFRADLNAINPENANVITTQEYAQALETTLAAMRQPCVVDLELTDACDPVVYFDKVAREIFTPANDPVFAATLNHAEDARQFVNSDALGIIPTSDDYRKVENSIMDVARNAIKDMTTTDLEKTLPASAKSGDMNLQLVVATEGFMQQFQTEFASAFALGLEFCKGKKLTDAKVIDATAEHAAIMSVENMKKFCEFAEPTAFYQSMNAKLSSLFQAHFKINDMDRATDSASKLVNDLVISTQKTLVTSSSSQQGESEAQKVVVETAMAQPEKVASAATPATAKPVSSALLRAAKRAPALSDAARLQASFDKMLSEDPILALIAKAEIKPNAS